MKDIIIIYAAGVLLNAFFLACVWAGLRSEGRLGRVRTATVISFTLLSFGTWVFAVCYLVLSLLRKGGGR